MTPEVAAIGADALRALTATGADGPRVLTAMRANGPAAERPRALAGTGAERLRARWRAAGDCGPPGGLQEAGGLRETGPEWHRGADGGRLSGCGWRRGT